MSIIGDLNRSGRTVLLITHDHDLARGASRCVTLRDGRIESDTRNTPVSHVRS
jgi:ABC-type lipoprotein export system ATPase subunit